MFYKSFFSVIYFLSAVGTEIQAVGEVGGMPKLGQSRKSRLRRHGKGWKKSVHGDLKLWFTGVIHIC